MIHCYLQIDNFIFAEKKIHLAQLRESAAGWVFLLDHIVFPFFFGSARCVGGGPVEKKTSTADA